MEHEYELVDEKIISDGFFTMKRLELRHSSFKGGWCAPVVRERLEELSAAGVLLYDPERDAVVLVEQFRAGLVGQQEPPWCLEIVAGFCDKENEQPAEVALREIREETGCEGHDLHAIGSYFVSPGFSVEQTFLYVARVDSSQAKGIHGLPEEGEEIRVVVMPREQAIEEIFGRLNSTMAVVAMQWLALNRDKLLSQWGLV